MSHQRAYQHRGDGRRCLGSGQLHALPSDTTRTTGSRCRYLHRGQRGDHADARTVSPAQGDCVNLAAYAVRRPSRRTGGRRSKARHATTGRPRSREERGLLGVHELLLLWRPVSGSVVLTDALPALRNQYVSFLKAVRRALGPGLPARQRHEPHHGRGDWPYARGLAQEPRQRDAGLDRRLEPHRQLQELDGLRTARLQEGRRHLEHHEHVGRVRGRARELAQGPRSRLQRPGCRRRRHPDGKLRRRLRDHHQPRQVPGHLSLCRRWFVEHGRDRVRGLLPAHLSGQDAVHLRRQLHQAARSSHRELRVAVEAGNPPQLIVHQPRTERP